jgi:hypothetical protein
VKDFPGRAGKDRYAAKDGTDAERLWKFAIDGVELRADGIANRIVPRAPDLAILIMPHVGLSRADPDLSFAKFTGHHRELRYTEIVKVNRLIVQCTEGIVFYRDARYAPSALSAACLLFILRSTA